MMDYDDDNADYWRARAVNLQYPDKGYRLCDTCEGVGVTMVARMTGSGHTECDEYCPDCGGDGQVEIKLKASVSRNKREGHYSGSFTYSWNGRRWRAHARTGKNPGNRICALKPQPILEKFTVLRLP